MRVGIRRLQVRVSGGSKRVYLGIASQGIRRSLRTSGVPSSPADRTRIQDKAKVSGPLCDIGCTLLQQLQFNSFPDTYLVPTELILFMMEKILLSPIWCDFIRDKMSIKELQQQNCTENRIVVQSL